MNKPELQIVIDRKAVLEQGGGAQQLYDELNSLVEDYNVVQAALEQGDTEFGTPDTQANKDVSITPSGIKYRIIK